MPALQVRDFPPDLYEELRECAMAEDRSISQQTMHILRTYLDAYGKAKSQAKWCIVAIPDTDEAPADTQAARLNAGLLERQERIERRKRLFEDIDSMPAIELPEGSPALDEIVRQMRDERADRITSSLVEHEEGGRE